MRPCILQTLVEEMTMIKTGNVLTLRIIIKGNLIISVIA